MWDWAIGHPEAVEEAFPELERIEKRHGPAAGEEGTEGFEGSLAGWAICEERVSMCIAMMV